MARKVHYEDNLFYLTRCVQNMRNGVSLDVDPEFFLEKTVDDVFFLDSSLVRLYSLLKENTYLISRMEHLRTLMRAKVLFTEFLDDMIAGKFPISRHLEQYFPKFTISLDEHRKDVNEIQDTLLSAQGEAPEDDDVISQQELRFLFARDTDSGEN